MKPGSFLTQPVSKLLRSGQRPLLKRVGRAPLSWADILQCCSEHEGLGFFVLCSVLGLEPWASHMVGKSPPLSYNPNLFFSF